MNDNESSLIAAMELLQEIKTEVLELSKQKDSLKTNIQVLDAFTDECKRDITDLANNLAIKPTKSIRLLKNVHLYRNLAYQEVFLDSNNDIMRYGDVFMNGNFSLNQMSGCNRTTNGFSFSRVVLPQDIEFKEIFGGHTTFYAVPKEGSFIYVWGRNIKGCAGAGHTNPIPLPIRIDMPHKVVKIVSGSSWDSAFQSAIALLEDGSVYVAGSNNTGQLGINNTLDVSTWTKNPYLSNIKDVFLASTGYSGVTLCIDDCGALYTFGYNAHGACGNAANANVLLPYKLVFEQRVKLAKASIEQINNIHHATSLILLEDGSILGAGYNGQKQLSQDNNNNYNSFVKLNILNGENEDFIDIFPASVNSTCFALKSDGRLFGFGHGLYGFGGDNVANSQIAHVVQENVHKFEYHDRTNTRAMVQLQNKELIAFGFNTDGSLGIGSNTNTKQFTKVILPSLVKDMKIYTLGAESYTCVLGEDSNLYACGPSLDFHLMYSTNILQKQN